MAAAGEVREGVQLVAVDGRRSSQAVGKAVFARAARYVDASVADAIETTPDWRKGYIDAVRGLVELGARSAKDALRVAVDGLSALHDHLEFVRGDDTVPLRRAFERAQHSFATAEIAGRGARVRELTIPYRGALLSGDELRRQIDAWERSGALEPSCARALRIVTEHPPWLDASDLRVALLGAASEMGPLPWLCRWGATVVAIDLPRPDLWERVVEAARAGSGRVLTPVRAPVAEVDQIPVAAGTDLLTQAPEVAAWLLEGDEPMVVGNYVYADGSTFVRLAGAVDALIEDLGERGRVHAIAYLATPTDVFAVPQEVVAAATGHRSRPHELALRLLSRGRLYAPNYSNTTRSDDGLEWGIYECLVPQQGANYALAKTVQRWRALVAREGGIRSSANVAPASRTRSVLGNKVLGAAYAGAHRFGVEVFEPATSSAIEAALLVHDLRNDASAANPAVPLGHPYELFVEGAAHGGLWRMPYAPRSVLPLAVLLGLARRRRR